MNKQHLKYAAIVAACLLFAPKAFAQNGINSPYSRYGFGIMSDRAMGFNKAMGGVAQGFRSGHEINTANPASYSEVDSLTALFDLGLSIYNGNYKMGNLQQNAKNASFDYFAFQFRAFRGVGMTLGILPYTNINYSFDSSSEFISGSDEITSSYSFSGNGGLHQLFAGVGARLFKPLSIGANISYLYGDYSHVSTMSLSESSSYSLSRSYTADIATYKLDAGFQLQFPINKRDKLTIGATYGLGHDINNRAYRTTQTLSSSSSGTSSVEGGTTDTLRNAFQLPHSISVGLSYAHSNKWRIGADFELEKWSEAKFPQAVDGTAAYQSSKNVLNDRTKFALGGEWTPDLYGGFFSRMTYRAGGYYSKSYANANGILSDKPYEFGVSAGMSIPVNSRYLWVNTPHINIAFQWVHTNIPYLTQAQTKSVLKENYLKLSLGITFSERWFYKWKVK
jgi:hypothetical protein